MDAIIIRPADFSFISRLIGCGTRAGCGRCVTAEWSAVRVVN